jgi:putative membrane protein
MTNERSIRTEHFLAFAIVLACVVIATGADYANTPLQNSNQNKNANVSTMEKRDVNKDSNAAAQTSSKAPATPGLSKEDRDFVTEAAMGGLMEVELGRIATQHATMDSVKQFAQRMVDDHSRANDELKQIATMKGITLPTELDEKHKSDLAKMSKLTGADFDKSYSKAMLNDHVKDVAAFEKESQKANDPDIKAFATKTLPTLKHHLEMARELNSQKKNAASTNSSSNE